MQKLINRESCLSDDGSECAAREIASVIGDSRAATAERIKPDFMVSLGPAIEDENPTL